MTTIVKVYNHNHYNAPIAPVEVNQNTASTPSTRVPDLLKLHKEAATATAKLSGRVVRKTLFEKLPQAVICVVKLVLAAV